MSKETKKERLQVRISEQDMIRIKQIAHQKNMTKSELIRKLIKEMT